MKKEQGTPLPLGVSTGEGSINFSITVHCKKKCRLLIYKAGEEKSSAQYEMPASEATGDIRFLAVSGMTTDAYEYNYEIDGEIIIDPYVKALTMGIDVKTARGKVTALSYDWEEDHALHIPYEDVIAYSMHIKGFTKHSSSKVKHKGTFAGVIEKLPYLQQLGINQIQCMPLYDFFEPAKYVNYWGYGPAHFFAPKVAYAAIGDGVSELKDMIKACHKSGIEVILDFPFTVETPFYMVMDALRYYAMNYHVDGFILNENFVDFKEAAKDPMLSNLKIMKKQDEFQNTMRRFLKGDEGMVESVIWWTKHHSKEDRIFNYMANHNGFTLYDAIAYDGKHNEKNGENNQDGPNYNYSWNCGAEGPTRKKSVLELRKKQLRNAFFLVLMSQGTPCILSGDEFANTQGGNNNVYCQDNETSWLDWRRLEKEKELFAYVQSLIVLRKSHPLLHPCNELLGVDQTSCGIPDVSYHGESAWRVPSEIASRQLGIYYSGDRMKEEDCFIAYNMHWVTHTFALPALKKGKKWYQVLETGHGICEAVVVKNQKEVEVDARTIMMFTGR